LIILEIIVYICCFYLLFPLGSSVLSLIMSKKTEFEGKKESDFACIITVYKEMDIAWPLVRSLLAQNYPHFHIYLVADEVEMVQPPFFHEKLSFLKPAKGLRSKVASIDYALNRIDKTPTHVVIFDPDNLVPAHFLSALDTYHSSGFPVVQGRRIAKNMNSTYAALDALGDYFYDYTVRKVPFSLGSSSVIAGSGMSVKFDLYRKSISKEMEELKRHGVVIAEDKSLQLMLVNMGHRIAYAEEAIIFDEKVTSFHQVSRQRSRWLNSYFKHSGEALHSLFKGILKGDWNRIWFCVTTLMPPLFILVLTSFFLGVFFLFVNLPMTLLLGLSLGVFSAGFLIILLLNHAPSRVLYAIPHIPLFVWGQISGLLNIRKANKDFRATSHDHIVEIDEVWQNRKEEFRHLSHLWEKYPD